MKAKAKKGKTQTEEAVATAAAEPEHNPRAAQEAIIAEERAEAEAAA